MVHSLSRMAQTPDNFHPRKTKLKTPMNTVTPRDYFAAHAPIEIPKWFDYKHPTKEPEEPVNAINEVPTEVKDIARIWLKESRLSKCTMLTERVAGLDTMTKIACAIFEKSWMDYHENSRKYLVNKDESKFFAWRWYYADQMMSLSK